MDKKVQKTEIQGGKQDKLQLVKKHQNPASLSSFASLWS